MQRIHTIFPLLLCLIAAIFSQKLWAQGEATMLFLKIPTSPVSNAMGWSGTALPSDDAFAFQFNPAMLGYAAKTTNLTYHPYIQQTDWLPAFKIPGLTFNSSALNLGYRSEALIKSMPIRFGFGYISTTMDYGEIIQTDQNGDITGVFGSRESYESFGFGVALESQIDINIGMTIKSVKSQLIPAVDYILQGDGKAKVTAIDLGVLLDIPIIRKKTSANLNNGDGFTHLNLSLGYARLNVGEKAFYGGLSGGDPIPREARLGYTISIGRSWILGKRVIEAYNIRWTTDAADPLIDSKTHEYRSSLLADINLWDEWIAGEADDSYIFRGGELQFFEFVNFRYGQFRGSGWYKPSTWGFGIQAKGLIKFLAADSNDPGIDFLIDHFDLRFHFAQHRDKDEEGDESPLHGTRVYGLEFQIGGF